MILGLPVDGQVVNSYGEELWAELVFELLVFPQNPHESTETKIIIRSSFMLAWLIVHFSELGSDADDVIVRIYYTCLVASCTQIRMVTMSS